MYSLYNKRTGRYLTHPKVGLWLTNDLVEAEDMLAEFNHYLSSEELSDLSPDLEIRAVTPDENFL